MRCVVARIARNVLVAGAVNILLFAALSSGCSGADNTNVFNPQTPGEDASEETTDAQSEVKPDVVPDVAKDSADAKDSLPQEASESGPDSKDAPNETTTPDAPDGEPDGETDAQEEQPCWMNLEVCNGLDDNCNGQKDEGDPGGNQACEVPNKLGECKAGTSHCQQGQVKCIQIVLPSEEFCDGKDNDCNGQIDDNPTDTVGPCNTGEFGVCAAGTLTCVSGASTCKRNMDPAASETCNGLDDNCDGNVDEGFPGSGQPCTVPGQVANTPCATGQTNCMGGQNGCSQTVFPNGEACNGADDDCDGTIDNPLVLEGKSCDSGMPGVCQPGKTQCTAGVASCSPDIKPGTVIETCNAKDDDCDGTVDNVANVKLECATKYPSAQNVLDWQCTTGNCEVAQCSGAYKDCDSAPANGCEVNSLTDLNHCGQCGQLCNSNHGTPSCVSGACQIACNNGWGNCNTDVKDGCEMPLSADVLNCGGCGNVCESSTGNPSCASGICSIVCNGGLGNCDGNVMNGCETSLQTDALHCGSCTTVCSTTGGIASCASGACQISCSPGMGNCDNNVANGCEDNLNSDPQNCGACATACSNANGTPGCFGGQCTITCTANYGNCDTNITNGCETNLKSSVSNCNGCGNVCSSSNGTPSCINGACTIACAAGWGNCDNDVTNGCETQLNTNANCAACGTLCNLANATESCSTGTCTLTNCNNGYGNCDGNDDNGCEISFSNDVSHCGSCTKSCSTVNGTPSCVSGLCSIVCANGFGNCDGDASNGCETDTKTSVTNCNACGQACSTVHGTPSCTNGTCSITCAAGYKNCDGSAANGCEIESNTDESNCGACGTVCSTNHATSVCTAGACVLTCASNFANCDNNVANGCEADLLNDSQHCGTCTKVCSASGGTPACNSGVCGITCGAGYGDCDGNAGNGCETNINTSASHCGGCGLACSTNYATEVCTSGACTVTSCTAGHGNCNNSAADGCEVTFATDPQHCGNCTTACNGTNGTPTCTNSACGITCNPGFGNCNSNVSDGCESNLKTDPANCNACGTACSTNHATPSCVNGACAVQSCAANYQNCNNNASDGCEVYVLTDVANCGSCGNACGSANGSASCSAGVCHITCNPGYGNCDNDISNGCEAQLNSLTNCGACGVGCNLPNATETCATGTCTLGTCTTGWGNCDSDGANGCETNLNTDAAHCGSCTKVCSNANGAPSCTAGVCYISCTSPYGNCDGQVTNGCETNTNISATNCGSCGAVCNSTNGTPGCTSGQCTISCNAGWGNCNGSTTDGCELNTTNNTSNCGSCGNACTADAAKHILSVDCNASACRVTGCTTTTPLWYDQNSTYGDGCECQEDTVANVASSATYVGTVVVDGSTNRTGNLTPTPTDSDWYYVYFNGGSCSFNPRIWLSNAGANTYIKVYTSSAPGTPLPCSTTETGTSDKAGLTEWKTSFSATCAENGLIDPTPYYGTFWQYSYYVWVQVYTTADYTNCGSYQLNFSN